MLIRDLSQYAISEDISLRAAMKRLGAAPHAFQLCIRADGTLAGTLTDGDVRRAILADAALDEPVGHWVHTTPITGRLDDDSGNLWALRRVQGTTRFIPVLDGEGRLAGVLVEVLQAEVPVALIMAGGRGSRLGHHTRSTPKPLVSVGGAPIIEHVIRRLESAGVSTIYVAAHYLAEQIDRFCSERNGQARLHPLHERERGGTAGAIGLLPESVAGRIIVVNADVLTAVDMRALVDFHERHSHDVSIAAAHHVVQIPYGVLRIDDEGQLQGVEEKPNIRHFVAAGIYVIGPRLRALVPAGRPIDMPELLNLGRAADLKIGVFPIHEYWRDVGRPDDLAAAETDVQQILR